MGEENRKRLSKREVLDFFACLLIMVVNLAGQSHFFVRIAISLAFGGTMGLIIDEIVSMEINITVGFFELFLW